MKTIIVGAGAMGSVFAAALVESGAEACLVDVDEALVGRLRSDGLRLIENGAERRVAVDATTDPTALGRAQAVLFFVKCMHTAAAAELVRASVAGDTAVVSLQNGWGNAEVLERAFDPARLAVGVTYTSATVVEPAVVQSSGPARTIIGDHQAGSGASRAIADALESAGFGVERPSDVRSRIWEKLVLNAATLPTSALTRLTAGALGGDPRMHALVRAAAAEAVAVGRAQGFDVALAERLAAIDAVLERAGTGKASMLQDVEAGRATEIDVISGAVIKAGEATGVEVPVTRCLDALVRGLEQSFALR